MTSNTATAPITKRYAFRGQNLRAMRKRRGLDPQDLAFKMKRLRLSGVPYVYNGYCLVLAWESGALAWAAGSCGASWLWPSWARAGEQATSARTAQTRSGIRGLSRGGG